MPEFSVQPEVTTYTIRNRIIYRIQETYFDGVALEDRAFLKNIAARDPLANLVRKPHLRKYSVK